MAQYDIRTGQTTTTRTDVDIDAGLRSYMLRVYNYMALGVAFTAVVVLFMMNNPALMRTLAVGPIKWVIFAAMIGFGFFAHKILLSRNPVLAHAGYWGYSALWGILIAPMVYIFFAKGWGDLVGRALAMTAATFAGVSLLGYTTKRDLTGWGGFLSMASMGLIIVMLGSYFLINDAGTAKMVSLGISIVTVLLFAAITAWETQNIKNMYLQAAYAGDREFVNGSAIFGAYMLYGSFVTLFVHILNILGIMRGEE